MITFTDPLFYLELLYFLPVTLLAFYIPGNVVLSSFGWTPLKTITLSFILGVVMWALQGMVFGYLHLRLFSYIYL